MRKKSGNSATSAVRRRQSGAVILGDVGKFCVRVCVCVRVRACARVRAYVRACVRACVRV